MNFFKFTLILFFIWAFAISSPNANCGELSLSVSEAVICQGVSDLQPMASGDIFPEDIDMLFCFSKITSPYPATIKHIWYKDDIIVAEVPLKIGISSGWRTYSSKKIPPSSRGNWKVEIVSEKGDLLKSVLFVIN